MSIMTPAVPDPVRITSVDFLERDRLRCNFALKTAEYEFTLAVVTKRPPSHDMNRALTDAYYALGRALRKLGEDADKAGSHLNASTHPSA